MSPSFGHLRREWGWILNIARDFVFLDSVLTIIAIATGPIAWFSLLLVESLQELDILEVFQLIIILISHHLVSCCSTFDVILVLRWEGVVLHFVVKQLNKRDMLVVYFHNGIKLDFQPAMIVSFSILSYHLFVFTLCFIVLTHQFCVHGQWQCTYMLVYVHRLSWMLYSAVISFHKLWQYLLLVLQRVHIGTKAMLTHVQSCLPLH